MVSHLLGSHHHGVVDLLASVGDKDEARVRKMRTSMLLEKVQTYGWANIQVSPDPVDILNLSRSLGTIVHQPSRPEISTLKPLEKNSAQANTTSALYGLGKFPFHTDLAHWPLPPRYVVMGNGNTLSNIPTLLLDTRSSGLFEHLCKNAKLGVWNIKKTLRPFACSLFLTQSNKIGLRWDSNVMSPLNIAARQIGTELSQLLESESRTHEISHKWNVPGLCVVIDNWRVLHSRPSIPLNEASRVLYRVFVSEKTS